MRTVVGWNGTLRAADEAVIPVWDHGFLYGMTLFETMRTYQGMPFLLAEHVERLRQACEALGIQVELNPSELAAHMADVMAANGLAEAYLRLTISAGEAGFGLPTGDYTQPVVLVLAKELPPAPPALYTAGKPLQLLATRRNTPESGVRFKSGHYMNNIVAKRELLQSPAARLGAEGAMLTEAGYVAEGIVSNLFAVKDGRLLTPAVELGILPGITRAHVLRLAAAAGIPTEEGMYTWDCFVEADELFMTSSVQELVPLTSIWERDQQVKQVGGGTIGPLTSTLLELYRASTTGAAAESLRIKKQ